MEKNRFEFTVHLSEDSSCGIGTIVEESALKDQCDITGTIWLQKTELGWAPDFWPRVLVIEPWNIRLSALSGYTADDGQIERMHFISSRGQSVTLERGKSKTSAPHVDREDKDPLDDDDCPF